MSLIFGLVFGCCVFCAACPSGTTAGAMQTTERLTGLAQARSIVACTCFSTLRARARKSRRRCQQRPPRHYLPLTTPTPAVGAAGTPCIGLIVTAAPHLPTSARQFATVLGHSTCPKTGLTAVLLCRPRGPSRAGLPNNRI